MLKKVTTSNAENNNNNLKKRVVSLLRAIYRLKRSNVANKSPVAAEKTASKKITLMLILTALIYSVCNLPYGVIAIFRALKYDSALPGSFVTFAYSLLVLLIFFKIPVFYAFNKQYRQVFLSYCKKIARCMFFCIILAKLKRNT